MVALIFLKGGALRLASSPQYVCLCDPSMLLHYQQFLLIAELYTIPLYDLLFIHSTTEGLLGCLQFLVIMKRDVKTFMHRF